jgi:hypothetical protein
MTTDREFDRITSAWLDLMPAEAPDRVIDSVLQAVGTTPQTRRPVLRGPRRSASMNRFMLVAAAAVLAAALVGVAVFAGGARNNQPAPTPVVAPTPVASPTVSQPATAPASLIGTWLGSDHAVAGIEPGSGSRLEITDTGLAFGPPNRQGVNVVSAALAGSAGDTLTVRSDSGPCAASDTGSYRWSLSASGNSLAITSGADACTERAAAFAGTWWKAGCSIGPTCLGDLDAGTYGSQFFSAGHNQANDWAPLFGGIGYTVPDGWSNSEDWPSRFMLTPSASYATEDSSGKGPIFIIHEVAVYAGLAAAVQDGKCAGGLDPAGGRTVADLERWLRGLPDVVTESAAPITIDGRQGRILDLRLRPGTTTACPGSPKASIQLLLSGGTPTDEAYGVVLAEGERMRLILLDDGGPVTAIVIDDRNDTLGEDPARFQSLLDAAMPIVQSFTFK